MMIVTIHMNVRTTKQKEFLQTLHELTEVMRKEKGFIDARIRTNGGNNNMLTFIAERGQIQVLLVEDSSFLMISLNSCNNPSRVARAGIKIRKGAQAVQLEQCVQIGAG
jgi:hypothetical protein